MGFLGEPELEASFNFVVLVSFIAIITCIALISCCIIGRKRNKENKFFVRLSNPRPTFCTLISNNDHYHRVLEEYGEKMDEMADLMDVRATSPSNPKSSEGSSNSGRRRPSEDKDFPHFPTSAEFPQWNPNKSKKSTSNYYHL